MVNSLTSQQPLRANIKIALDHLRNLNLVQQFALAGSIVVLIAMTVVGRWVASQIESAVINSTSAATALYMDAILAPFIPTLMRYPKLPKPADRRIQRLMQQSAFGQRIISIKIWKQGGVIAYSNDKSLIGRKFETGDHQKMAWTGVVSAEFDSLDDDEDRRERATGLPLLEMYMPVRERSTGKIMAVAEFYILAETLRTDLARATERSWLIVGMVTLAMMGALFFIVLRGNRTIEHQRESLKVQVNRLTALLDENRQLSRNLGDARRRATRINESFLRRIGADLHDGPAQLIGHALLRIDMLRQEPASKATQEENNGIVDTVENSLRDALAEIRRQSAGLALPELDTATVDEAIKFAVNRHERQTQTTAALDMQAAPIKLPSEITVCVYRFIQEGLNNAFRHANAQAQAVTARIDQKQARIDVTDRGPGFKNDALLGDAAAGPDRGIGLAALRDRIETLGGSFAISPRQRGGTRLTLKFNLTDMERPNV